MFTFLILFQLSLSFDGEKVLFQEFLFRKDAHLKYLIVPAWFLCVCVKIYVQWTCRIVISLFLQTQKDKQIISLHA